MKTSKQGMECGVISGVIVIECKNDALVFFEHLFDYYNNTLSSVCFIGTDETRYFLYTYNPVVQTVEMFMNTSITVHSDNSFVPMQIDDVINPTELPDLPAWLIGMLI